MKIKILILFIISLLASPAVSAAGSGGSDKALAEAAREYKGGNFEKAVEIYKSLSKSEGVSAGLLYDMGNSYVRLHDFGNAMLCYQRARRLDPGNEKILNNLSYLTNQVDAQNRSELKGKPVNVSADEPWFFRSIYNSFARDVTSDFWAVMAAVSFILCILFIADYIFTKRVILRKIGFFGGIAFLGLAAIFVAFSVCAAREAVRETEAVITAETVEFVSDPTDNAKSVSPRLNQGTVVEVQKTEGGTSERPDWYNVRLNSEFAGWVKSTDVEII